VFLYFITLVVCAVMVYPQTIPTPTFWPGSKTAAVSLTYDDNHPVQLKYAVPEMAKRNVKGTFFIVTGDAGWGASYQWQPIDWNQAIAMADSGHEIGGHAVTHSPSVSEVRPALDSLQLRFPGKKWWTWAYPGGNSDAMSEVKRWCISARGWNEQGIEDNVPANPYLIKTIGNVGTIADIENAVNKSGWLVETIHCIYGSSGECSLGSTAALGDYIAHLDTLSARRSLLWIAPYGDVFRYIQERENATITLSASDAMSQTFSFTDTLPDSIYNLPLTLSMSLPAGWTGCKIEQNGKGLSPVLQQTRVMFDAVPDNGPIVLSKRTLPASPFNATLWDSGTPESGSGPDLMVYLAPQGRANGAAIIVCPGGGYGTLKITEEGTQVAQWLNTQGIAGIVLPYRLARHPVPLEDGQRAVRLVRAKAAEWGLDTAKIGIMGFSAGGHLASTIATHYNDSIYAATDSIDRLSDRPSFQLLIYPVISFWPPLVHTGSMTNLLGGSPSDSMRNYLSNDIQVKPSTPPAFLAHALDDATVPIGNGQAFYDSCLSKHVPAEFHIYPKGGHGFYPYDSTILLWAKDGLGWLSKLDITNETVDSGSNMALGKPVTGSSLYESNGWGAAKLVDGILTSIPGSYGYTSACHATPDAVEWVEVDLRQDMIVNQVKLYSRTDNLNADGESPSFPVDFTIQGRNQAGIIETLFTATGYPNPRNIVQVFDCNAVSIRYVRVHATLLGNAPIDNTSCRRLQLAEMEVYNNNPMGIQRTVRPGQALHLAVCPNPFNPVSHINFTLPITGYVNLSVYDISGRLVKTLISRETGAGQHAVIWDATDAKGRKVSCGVYVYLLKTQKKTLRYKSVLIE